MSRTLLLLALVLAIGAALWLLLDAEEESASETAVRPRRAPSPDATLVGTPDAGATAVESASENADRPAWWHLGFRVQGPDGADVPFAKAWLVRENGTVARTLVPKEPTSKGEFLVSGACRLAVRVEGYCDWRSEWLHPTETGRRDVVVRTVAGLPLAGVLVRPDGETPRPKHRLVIETIPYAGAFLSETHEVHTDDDGRFRLEGLPPGQVRITVWVSGGFGMSERTSVVATVGDEALRVVAKEPDAKCRVDVFVVDAQAKRAPQDTTVVANVTVDGKETRWVLRYLEPRERPPERWWLGSYPAVPGSTHRIRIEALGYEQIEPCTVEVPDVGPHRVTIPLRPRPDRVAHLDVRLVMSGRPAPRIVVGLYDHPEIPIHLEHATVGGHLRLRVPAGKARLTVETPWEPDEAKEVQEVYVGGAQLAPEGGARLDLDLALRLGGYLFLAGDPDAWAPTLNLARGQETISRTAANWTWREEEGFLFGPVPPGTWTVAYDGTDAHWSGEVEIQAGKVSRVHRDALTGTPHPESEDE